MKITKNLTFAAQAALAVTLLFQTSITRASAQGKEDGQSNSDATINFTKWVTQLSPPSGVFADMAGVIGGGDVGDGTFTGEVLTRSVDSLGVITVEAVYHLHGSKHSFTARIHAVQQVAGVGQTGVIIGEITDGWLKGHVVQGGWTVIPPCGYDGGVGIGNCFAVTLDIIKRHSSDHGQGAVPSSPFVILLEGVYEPVINAPNLGLSVDLRDQTLIPLKIGIYNRDSGVPSPGEKPIGTFYVQLMGDLCTYHLPGGSFAAQFVGGGFDITDDGNGSWTGTGTWELNILEATGTYKPFAGGHIHMVDVLKFRAGDGTLLEHCFCHVSL